MTHIDNIPHIMEHGITHANSVNANPMYVSIGDSSIIMKRKDKLVTTVDGESFLPGDYIPFYFYARMPMLYNIQHGYCVEKKDATEIVYLIVSLNGIINDPAQTFYFSDGHALANKWTKFYSKRYIDKIDSLLDIEAIKNNNWGENYEIGIRKQAEFFVREDIDVANICMIVCHDRNAYEKLVRMNINVEIRIIPTAYF